MPDLNPQPAFSDRPSEKARRSWSDALFAIRKREWQRGNDSYSTRALARKCGVSQTVFVKVLHGERPMPAHWLDLLPIELAMEMIEMTRARRMPSQQLGERMLRDGLERLAISIAKRTVTSLPDLEDVLVDAERDLATLRADLARQRRKR